MTEEKVCFVISPIGDYGSDIRKRSDLIYEYIIRPVVKEFGYHLTRADYIKEPGIITSQIIDQIVESSLVIADLSDNNPNVFYELAIRHTIQKPYIQMIRSGQKIPFDINGLRTIHFDFDLKSADSAKKELFEQINSIQNGKFNKNNPITSAVHQSNIQKMLASSEDINSDDFSKIVLESVSELRSIVLDLKADFHNFKFSEEKPELNKNQFKNTLVDLEHQISKTHKRIDDVNFLIKKDADKPDEKICPTEQYYYEIEHLETELYHLLTARQAILDNF